VLVLRHRVVSGERWCCLRICRGSVTVLLQLAVIMTATNTPTFKRHYWNGTTYQRGSSARKLCRHSGPHSTVVFAWLYMLRFIATFHTNWYITPWQHNTSINRNKLWNSYLMCAIRHCSPACLVHNFRCQWYTVYSEKLVIPNLWPSVYINYNTPFCIPRNLFSCKIYP
jgi:hypothetical protein